MSKNDKSSERLTLVWTELAVRFSEFCDHEMDRPNDDGEMYKLDIYAIGDDFENRSRRFMLKIYKVEGTLLRCLFFDWSCEDYGPVDPNSLGFTSCDAVDEFEIGRNCWPSQDRLELMFNAGFFRNVDSETEYRPCSDFYWGFLINREYFGEDYKAIEESKKIVNEMREKYLKSLRRRRKQFSGGTAGMLARRERRRTGLWYWL